MSCIVDRSWNPLCFEEHRVEHIAMDRLWLFAIQQDGQLVSNELHPWKTFAPNSSIPLDRILSRTVPIHLVCNRIPVFCTKVAVDGLSTYLVYPGIIKCWV